MIPKTPHKFREIEILVRFGAHQPKAIVLTLSDLWQVVGHSSNGHLSK